jgi:COP9 signalosome complex subunit 3
MLAQSTDNKALEQFLARLIADGDLDAQLVQSSDPLNPTVVRFNIRPTHRDLASEVKSWARLIAQNDRLRPLMERVCEADVKQELSPEYVNNLKRARRHKDNGNGEGDMLTRVAHDEVDLEEDIMGGEH